MTRKPAPKKKKPAKGSVKRPAPKRAAALPPARPEVIAPPTAHERGVAIVPRPRTRAEIVAAICLHVANRDAIHLSCSKEGITWTTLWEWKDEDAALEQMYQRARKASALAFESRSTEVVEDTKVEVDRARLIESNARWRAKMADPKGFGDKVDVTSAGERLGLEELVAGSMTRQPAR